MRMHRAISGRPGTFVGGTFVGMAALAVLLIGSALAWHRYFRMPEADLRPLAPGLVAFASPEGQRLLERSRYTADYEPLVANFEGQSRPAYCGVASSVMTLNALRAPHARLDQSTFFSESAREVRHPLRVTVSGMSLSNLGDLLRAHGAEARHYPASDLSIDRFRAIARQNLSTPGDFVLVNYQRAALGQEEIGHISPLAAYDATSDRFLILDVAAHKYPSVWVSTEALWKAMSMPLGSGSPYTRGFIVVREGRRSS